MMTRTMILACALALASLTTRLAQEIHRRANEPPARGDYEQNSARAPFPGGGRIARLSEQRSYDQLTDACKQVVDAQKK